MKEKCLLIVTNKPGLLEQTQQGKLALVAEPNADSLYQKMLEAIRSVESNRKMISEARNYIDSLSWPKLAKRKVDAF